MVQFKKVILALTVCVCLPVSASASDLQDCLNAALAEWKACYESAEAAGEETRDGCMTNPGVASEGKVAYCTELGEHMETASKASCDAEFERDDEFCKDLDAYNKRRAGNQQRSGSAVQF